MSKEKDEKYRESFASISTYQSFVPPPSDTVSLSNATLKSCEEENKIRVITIDNIDYKGKGQNKVKVDKFEENSKKKDKIIIVLTLLLFIVAIGLIYTGFIAKEELTLAEDNEDEPEDYYYYLGGDDGGGGTDNEPEDYYYNQGGDDGGGATDNDELPGFCAEFSPTDSALRKTLADNFDLGFNESREQLYYRFLELGCLPENAFSLLTQVQKANMKKAIVLGFIRVDLFKVHPNAFEEDLVKQIRLLSFSSNKLSELPDNVFKPFKSIAALGFHNQNFVTLNNNLFGETSTLTSTSLTNMPNLVAFPEFLKETPKLVQLTMMQSVNIVEANSAAFVNLKDLYVLYLSTNTRVLVNLGPTELALALNVTESVIRFQF